MRFTIPIIHWFVFSSHTGSRGAPHQRRTKWLRHRRKRCKRIEHPVKWNLACVIIVKPPDALLFLLRPQPKPAFAPVAFADVMVCQTVTPPAAERYPSPHNGASRKYICYPFVQFIELSEVSGPARPQIGPVRREMERELSRSLFLFHIDAGKEFPSGPID